MLRYIIAATAVLLNFLTHSLVNVAMNINEVMNVITALKVYNGSRSLQEGSPTCPTWYDSALW